MNGWDRLIVAACYATALVAAALAIGLTAPLWAGDGPSTETLASLYGTTMATLYPASGAEPRNVWVSQEKCQQFLAFQQKNDLFVEDVDLPREKVVRVECRCVEFEAEEASQ